jgi:geranylgeranyl diphosphate synthase type 3
VRILSSDEKASTELRNCNLDILQQRPETPTLKDHAVSYLERETGSFDYTYRILVKLERQTRVELARLGGNPLLEAIVDKLAAPIE